MLLRAPGTRARCQHERDMTDDGRGGRHQNRTQPRAGRLDHCVELVAPCLLQVIGELHDQNAVLRHEPDQGDQPDLTVDVERGPLEEREQQRAGDRERHRPGENDERIAEALELCREDEIDQDRREQKCAEEPATLRSELARLTRIVDREALWKGGAGFVFQERQRLIEGNRGRNHPLYAHRVELLEFLQLTRLGGGLQAGEGGERDKFVVGPRNVHLLELVGRQAIRPLHLRNHLVAAPLDAESVDVISADQR